MLPSPRKVYVLLDSKRNLMKGYVGSDLGEIAERLKNQSGRVLIHEVQLGRIVVATGFLSVRDRVL